jgi:pimeloyl-ACP methyl ester carboxylesterase
MAIFVLVHGAWHGGWCWERVASRLRDDGHEVLTPTLTGLGERADELTPNVGLRTHVEDIVDVLLSEDLEGVELVGHSYAGFVAREAADREPGRIARITMLDAWAGRDGESVDSRAPKVFSDWVARLTEGDAIAVPPPATVGVTDPADVAWLEANLTPHPRLTFAEPTRLAGAVDAVPCRAIVCAPGPVPFAQWAAEFGWPTTRLDTGHDAMVTAPAELATELMRR